MMEEVIKLACTNGLWAVLFVVLLIYQIRTSMLREQKYQALLEKLANNVAIIKNVDKNVRSVAKNVDIMLTTCRGEKFYEQANV